MAFPLISMTALEVWRASGKRTFSRLRELVLFFATTNGETAHVEFYQTAAIAETRTWEIEEEAL